MEQGWREFFLRYTSAELETVTKVLGDLLTTEKRGVRLFIPAAARASGSA